MGKNDILFVKIIIFDIISWWDYTVQNLRSTVYGAA